MADNIKETIKEFDNLIKKHPDIQELYIGRALLYTKTKQYKKAIEDYKKGCENYVCYDIMNICKRNALIKEAEDLYTKKIKKQSNAVNYLSRMRFYISIGEDKKALDDCETILKISPKSKFVAEIKEVLEKKLKDRQMRNIKRKVNPILQ